MEISHYVFYELLIRLQELNPDVGEYTFSKKTDSGVLLITTSGSVELPEEILYKQFMEPSQISQTELMSLLRCFRFAVVE